ncbi:MAG: exodeoxyribonuclease VII small subunit [Candidatus Bipolaricaulota bacterium]|nr:exodeoxyribonuclease VII small subunit [Candidatus Bipolaricaulota bacterium]
MKIDESLKRLEEITKRMEDEQLPLEEAIELFEEGINLARGTQEELRRARLKIDKVIEKAKGEFSIEDFDLP